MRACTIYDNPTEEYLSLYSVLCMKMALNHHRRWLFKVISYSSKENSQQTTNKCYELLKLKVDKTIKYFEGMPVEDVIQTIDR